MRCMREKIARTANDDDESSGRFWAGRFKSVALLDEATILTCSVHVDLNPIWAGLATMPEEMEEWSDLGKWVRWYRPSDARNARANSALFRFSLQFQPRIR